MGNLRMAHTTRNILRVFVYGTLKIGEPNHYWLTDDKNCFSKFLCNGYTTKKYPLVIGTQYNIPFLLDKPGIGNYIKGEIYDIDDKMLSKLDVLEDYPDFYDREIQDIKTDNGIYLCWVYLIRNFPDKMLSKKFLESYTNTTEQPYKEQCERDENVSSKNDLNY